MFQGMANWGAARGGAVGAVALNVGAGLNAASEAFGTNDLGRAIGEGSVGGTAIALAGMLPVGKVGKVGKVVREFEGGALAAHEALNAAEQWLGKGYREISNGVFRSADGARQFRMTVNDLVKDVRKGPHVHFEAIGADGREILENAWLRIKP